MKLHLTPEMLEAAYELLKTTPPFRSWKLPDADDIEFRVYIARDRHAGFRGALLPGVCHEIQVSIRTVKTLPKLIGYMAHEMIHMRQHLINCPGRGKHDARFKRLAKQVCCYHGFEEAIF
jgi:hypothetical protein